MRTKCVISETFLKMEPEKLVSFEILSRPSAKFHLLFRS